MKVSRLLLCGIIILGLLYASVGSSAAVPSTASNIDPVWFGSFINTLPDGKVSHDVSALVLAQDGTKLSGSVGPSIDRLAPFTSGSIRAGEISFHLDAGGGINFVLHLSNGHLIGTARGSRVNAVLDLTPARGLMPHGQLVAEITAADTQNFAAFENCDADQYMTSLSPELEFYQDNQPVKDRQQIIESLKYRCAEGIKLRRELDSASLIINSAPPDFAIEAGLHRFYSKQPDGSERLEATARFTLVWSKKSGKWQLIRSVSYDHR